MGNKSNSRVKSFEREVSSSEIFSATDDFLSNTSVKSLVYSDDYGNTYYFYTEEEGLANLLRFYKEIEPVNGGVESEILNESDENIKSMLISISQSSVAKELLSGILTSLTNETVNAADIKFNQESEAVILLKNLVNAEDYTTINAPEAVGVLSSSYMVDAVASNNSGMLASMPDAAKDEFKASLGAKRSNGEISEGRYNVLMSMFDVN